jgi:hypothetical protein
MGIRGLRSIACASLCALVWLSTLVVSSASAHLTHPYLCQITGSATPSSSECNLVGNTVPGGAFGEPRGVAVDSTGQVYVSDNVHNVVDVFDSTGNFTRQITGPSAGAAFADPFGLALDGSNDLWVSDVGFGVGEMDKFDASGDLLAQGNGGGHWNGEQTESIAYSDLANRLYVADSFSGDLWVLNSDGSYDTEVTGPWRGFIRVAIDNSGGPAQGDVYVASNRGVIYRIDSAGAPAEFSGAASYISGAQLTGTPEGAFGEPSDVAVDPAGNIYVVDRSRDAVDEFNAQGLFVAKTSGVSAPDGSFGPHGIAVDAAGRMYVAAASGDLPAAVDVFGPLAELPSVAIGAAANIEASGAELAGTVNPENAGDATCVFQWGTTVAYGHTAACSELVANGASPAAVHTQLSGLQADTTYHYRLTATNGNGTEAGKDATFTTPGPPIVDSESTEVAAHEKRGQTSATLHALITPDRSETTYLFEYGETPSYGTTVPASPESIGSGGSPVSVPATELTGLKIGATYHYRVVASNKYGTADGPDQTFTTLPTLLIDSESAATVTATSATIEAQLNPLGTNATYHFEYGTSASYGTTLPVPDGDAGASESAVPVYVHLQGLQLHTTYHYRIVAVNAPAGEPVTVDGLDRTFTTQAAATAIALPDGRQWEMVSPPNKQGAGIYADGYEQGSDIQAAASGDGITYTATGPFVQNPAGSRSPEATQVISMRHAPESWETADITAAHNERKSPYLLAGQAAEYKLFSSDLSLGLVQPVGTWPLPPLPPEAEQTDYLREANGAYKALVTASNVPAGTKFGGDIKFISASPDLDDVVLASGAPLVNGAPDRDELYEWAGGQLQLVSVLPNGKPVSKISAEESEPSVGLGNTGNEKSGIVRNAISGDGSRVVWELKRGGAPNYYLRDTIAKETVQIDAAQEGLPEPTVGGERYMTASSTGSRVFFTSAKHLSTDASAAGEDLYAFEITNGKDEPLTGSVTDLTPSAGEAADVVQVIGASEDGSYIYFVAREVLGDGAANGAEADGHNLYLVRYDEAAKAWSSPSFIAPLADEDAPTWGNGDQGSLQEMTSRVSPNGRYLAFMSDRSLTGYESRDANSGVPDEEVFLYDANTNRLVCASCNPTGGRPVGLLVGNHFDERLVDYTAGLWENRWLAGNVPAWTTEDLSGALYQSRYLENSGRLFFDSSGPLVPADVNGREDVYEYEPSDVGSCQPPGYGQSASVIYSEQVGGCIGLISAGTSSEESAFLDASETGGDVFFLTESRLSSKDYDTSFDIYDAHECTVTVPCAPPARLTPPPCDTGDACKPAPSPQPTLFGPPSSETFAGAGNIAPGAPQARATPRVAGPTGKLAKALKACRRMSRRRRAACERRTRKRFAAGRSRARKSTTAAARR